MGQIESSGGIPPQWRDAYQKDFARSVDLFQKSLDEYYKTDDVNKKAKFKDVMDKALQIMNETARGFISKGVEEQKEQLEKDYQSFNDHESPTDQQKLNKDIDRLKRTI